VVTRGHSWSLVVTRGHSWSLVVTRGHSCVLLDKTCIRYSVAGIMNSSFFHYKENLYYVFINRKSLLRYVYDYLPVHCSDKNNPLSTYFAYKDICTDKIWYSIFCSLCISYRFCRDGLNEKREIQLWDSELSAQTNINSLCINTPLDELLINQSEMIYSKTIIVNINYATLATRQMNRQKDVYTKTFDLLTKLHSVLEIIDKKPKVEHNFRNTWMQQPTPRLYFPKIGLISSVSN
jgi:hypothetical protein